MNVDKTEDAYKAAVGLLLAADLPPELHEAVQTVEAQANAWASEVDQLRETMATLRESWEYGKQPIGPGFSSAWWVRMDRILTGDAHQGRSEELAENKRLVAALADERAGLERSVEQLTNELEEAKHFGTYKAHAETFASYTRLREAAERFERAHGWDMEFPSSIADGVQVAEFRAAREALRNALAETPTKPASVDTLGVLGVRVSALELLRDEVSCAGFQPYDADRALITDVAHEGALEAFYISCEACCDVHAPPACSIVVEPTEQESPPFTPASLQAFAARGYERVNRHGKRIEVDGKPCPDCDSAYALDTLHQEGLAASPVFAAADCQPEPHIVQVARVAAALPVDPEADALVDKLIAMQKAQPTHKLPTQTQFTEANAIIEQVSNAFAYTAPELFSGTQYKAMKALGEYVLKIREQGKA